MANYVFNSASSGDTYNAKCLNVSDDSEWTPSAAEYPQDGTIDLSGGVAGRYLDTQWTAPQDTEWTMSGIYNVAIGVSYDMYSIHYKTGNLCDIYLGSDTEDLVLSESDKPYTPPTGTWKVYEEPPAIIIPIVNLVVNGYFDTDLTGWNTSGGGTTWVSGEAYMNVLGTTSESFDQTGIVSNLDVNFGTNIHVLEGSMRVILYDNTSTITSDTTYYVDEAIRISSVHAAGVNRVRFLKSAETTRVYIDNVEVSNV